MTDLQVSEYRFESWDGSELFYRAWHPEGRPRDRAVVFFHSGHEHSGRLAPVIESLQLQDISFYAWDARGHGLSPGKRGYASSFGEIVRDANSFIESIGERDGIGTEDIAVMGHSEGSVIASSLVLDHRPGVRGMVLGSPALRIKLYLPFAYQLLKTWVRLRPEGYVGSFVMNRMLTHDPEQRRLRASDPLIKRPIGARLLLDILDEGRRLVEMAPRIAVPTLVLSAGSDMVVRLSTQRDFFARLGSSSKEHVIYEGFYHHVFHEKERDRPIGKARAFLEELFI